MSRWASRSAYSTAAVVGCSRSIGMSLIRMCVIVLVLASTLARRSSMKAWSTSRD
jgi:hypothetical protein